MGKGMEGAWTGQGLVKRTLKRREASGNEHLSFQDPGLLLPSHTQIPFQTDFDDFDVKKIHSQTFWRVNTKTA